MGHTFGGLIFNLGAGPWTMVMMGIASALAGMISHWAKVYFKDGVKHSITDWYIFKNPKGTLLAVVSMLGALFAAFAPLDYTTLSLYQVITQAFAIGYAADTLNGLTSGGTSTQ
jgi:hypothetical protein